MESRLDRAEAHPDLWIASRRASRASASCISSKSFLASGSRSSGGLPFPVPTGVAAVPVSFCEGASMLMFVVVVVVVVVVRGDGRGESAPTVIKKGLSIFRNSIATDLAEGLGLGLAVAMGVGVPIPLSSPISVPVPVPSAELGPDPGLSIIAESEAVLSLGVGVGVGFALMDCAPPLLPAPELGVPVNQRLKAVFVNSRDWGDWGVGGATSESGAWMGTRPSARGDTRTMIICVS